MADEVMRLEKWAFLGSREFYTRRLNNLAEDLPDEKWSATGKDDYGILYSYIRFTWQKLWVEMKDADPCEQNDYIYTDEESACFNTGLFTKYLEPVFFYAKKNDPSYKQEWRFMGFYSEYTIKRMGTSIPAAAISKLRRANYFSNPADLIFNINLKIVPQWAHILEDYNNFQRIPKSISDSGVNNCRKIIQSAINDTQKRIEANYKTVVPQYYTAKNEERGKIQLLAPLYLRNDQKPDLALVLELSPDKSQYLGTTCLTTEMAYKNARLIARPDSYWLLP